MNHPGSSHSRRRRHSADARFLDRLKEANIAISTEEKAIAGGHSVCDSLDAGYTVDQVNDHLLANVTNATAYEIGYVVGAGVSPYCPEYGDQIV